MATTCRVSLRRGIEPLALAVTYGERPRSKALAGPEDVVQDRKRIALRGRG